MKKWICLILCLLTLTSFTLVMVQEHWKPFEMKPLQGFADVAEKPELTLANIASGNYQNNLERYIGDHFGFREFFIRAYNQFTYSCFRKINNDNIVVGADQELFLKMYLDDATGTTLKQYFTDVEAAKAEAQKNVEETLRLIDTLHQHGKDFLFVFAPTKPAVYPDKLPSYYRKHLSEFSLEEYYIQLFKENNIPHIDFYHYFQAVRDTFPYPLYPRTGTHWAEATIPFVADSLLRKLAEITDYKLPTIRYVDDNISSDYSPIDGELEALMNLLLPLNKPAIPLPVFELTDTVGTDKPDLLVVGDSYFTRLRSSAFVDAFNSWEAWVYNREVHSSNPRHRWKQLDQLIDAYEVLEDADIVMPIFTGPMYYKYMFGFLQTAQNLFQNGEISEGTNLRAAIQMIKEDDAWMKAVEEQAKELGVTVEENLRQNGIYVLEKRKELRTMNH